MVNSYLFLLRKVINSSLRHIGGQEARVNEIPTGYASNYSDIALRFFFYLLADIEVKFASFFARYWRLRKMF